MKKITYILLGLLIAIGGTVLAVQVTVPSSNGQGFFLQSTTTGNYLPVSLTAGTNITISTTSSNVTISSTNPGGTVTSVTGTYPIISSGGNTPAISTAFGTTSTIGVGNDLFLYTSHTGVIVGAASSSLSLPNSALQNSTISSIALGGTLGALTATDGTLTFSGSYTGATARTIGVNLTNTNAWTASATTTFTNGLQSSYLSLTGSTATSTAASGINLTGGCFSVNSTCIGGSSLTGTTGQTAYFSGTNTAVGTSTVFISTASNVGIGTVSPAFKLDVNGISMTTRLGVGSNLGGLTTTPGHQMEIVASGTNAPLVMAGGSAEMELWKDVTPTKAIAYGMAVPGNSATDDLIFSLYNGASWAERMRILNANGNVGIGVSAPQYQLSVVSATAPQLSIGEGAGKAQVVFRNESGTLAIASTTTAGSATSSPSAVEINTNTGAVPGIVIPTSYSLSGFSTSSPYATVSIQSNASTGDAFAIATSSGNPIFGVDNDGHKFTSGPAGIISSCGTGTGTVVGDDQSGTITTATAATACTLTFAKAYRATPSCTATDDSLVGFADISSISTSAVTFGISSALTGGKIYYNCQYHK